MYYIYVVNWCSAVLFNGQIIELCTFNFTKLIMTKPSQIMFSSNFKFQCDMTYIDDI